MATLKEIEEEYRTAVRFYREHKDSDSAREAYEIARVRVIAARDKIREEMPRHLGFHKEDRDGATF